jgi:enoyl-CoA hydratase
MSDSVPEYVHVSVDDDGLAVVRIDDPNDENYVKHSHPMHRELRDIWPTLSADPQVRGVVLAGGEEQFYPVPTMQSLAAILRARPGIQHTLQREARDIARSIIDFPKPLVAAVATDAHGMGAQIAFLCDFAVSARGVRFQDTHTRLGLTSGDGATLVWPLVVGLARARRYVLRGHPLSAAEAYEFGLLSDLVESPEEVLPSALAVARKLISLPAAAFQTTKFALNQWLRLGATISLEVASALEVGTYDSPEFRALCDAAMEEKESEG